MATKKIIKAGGGLVRNEVGDVLMIFRRGHWDLPKGKLDPGETIEECALREVEEECGIGGLVLGPLVGTTEHEYTEHGEQIVKQTSWFEMSGSGTLTPQTEEEIQLAQWVPTHEIQGLLDKAYPTIATLLRSAL